MFSVHAVSEMSAHVQTRPFRQAGRLSRYHCSVNKARGHVVFESSGKVFLDCADRIESSTSHSVVYFACLSGRCYLFACWR